MAEVKGPPQVLITKGRLGGGDAVVKARRGNRRRVQVGVIVMLVFFM